MMTYARRNPKMKGDGGSRMRPVKEAVRIASHTDEYNYHLARKESTLNECTGRAEDCMCIEATDAEHEAPEANLLLKIYARA
jgi:hypothetical protein